MSKRVGVIARPGVGMFWFGFRQKSGETVTHMTGLLAPADRCQTVISVLGRPATFGHSV